MDKERGRERDRDRRERARDEEREKEKGTRLHRGEKQREIDSDYVDDDFKERNRKR